MLPWTIILKQVPCRIVNVIALNRLWHALQDHLVFYSVLQWPINKTCYCKLLTGIRFMDMPVNVNRSMMLKQLRAGKGLSSMAFCRGIPNSPPCTLRIHSALCWHVLNTDNPRTCRFYQNLPTALQWQGIYFCVPCWARCANWAFGCGWMQTPSVICIHSLSFQGNRQDSSPPPPFVNWPRWNIPCNWKLGNYCEFEHMSKTYQTGI